MIYSMNLHSHPFDLIKSCQKTIEMRLATPERLSIKVGDFIELTNRNDGEKLRVLAIAIKRLD